MSRNYILLGVLVGVVFISVAVVAIEPEIITDYDSREIPQRALVEIREVSIDADISRSSEDIIKGLSGRRQLDEFEGMLFVFQNSMRPSFWMKDMNFDLDMIWMDSDGYIVDISHNVRVDSFPETFSPREASQYILEVNAGFAEKYLIEIGDHALLSLY